MSETKLTDAEVQRLGAIMDRLTVASGGPWHHTLVEADEGNLCIQHQHYDIYRTTAPCTFVTESTEPGFIAGRFQMEEPRDVNVACVLADNAADVELMVNARADLYWLARLVKRLSPSSRAPSAERSQSDA